MRSALDCPPDALGCPPDALGWPPALPGWAGWCGSGIGGPDPGCVVTGMLLDRSLSSQAVLPLQAPYAGRYYPRRGSSRRFTASNAARMTAWRASSRTTAEPVRRSVPVLLTMVTVTIA